MLCEYFLKLVATVQDRNTSLLELFLTGPGRVVRVVVGESRGDDCWLRALPPIINMSAQLLWPRCASSTFLNFLLRSNQHTIIQNYCRLITTSPIPNPLPNQ